MKNTATKSFTAFASILFLFIAGAFAQTNLDDTEWKLVQANGVAVTNSSASLKINDKSTRFTGSTGCNSMFGALLVSGRRIDIWNIGSTKRMCKLMAGNVAENLYLQALRDTQRFRINGNNLVLMDRRNRDILKFKRVGDDNDERIGLGNRKWVLESIKGRQTFVPIKGAFLNFDVRKGSAGGDTSCNVFGGDYSATGSTIRFTNIISTMRACIEDNKMAVERDMLDGLRRADRFQINNGRLQLYRGLSLLLTFRAEAKQ